MKLKMCFSQQSNQRRYNFNRPNYYPTSQNNRINSMNKFGFSAIMPACNVASLSNPARAPPKKKGG